MRNDIYIHTPHAYHAQTFSLNPAPFLEPLTRHVPVPAPNPVLVLDVGCGSGRDMLWLKQRGYDVLGLERSPGLAELARKHTGCEVLCEDFDVFDFTTLSVDAVILIGALVHVPRERPQGPLPRHPGPDSPGPQTRRACIADHEAGGGDEYGRGWAGVCSLAGSGFARGFRGLEV